MLSDVYKDKLAANLEKMTEIRVKYPTKFRHVLGYKEMEEENRFYVEQINKYKALINGTHNKTA